MLITSNRRIFGMLALPVILVAGAVSSSFITHSSDAEPVQASAEPVALPVVHEAPPMPEFHREPPALAPRGSAEVLEVEVLLNRLGYWTGTIDGRLDPISAEALVAFNKVEGNKRDSRVGPATIAALRAASRPLPLETGRAHYEVDLARQVLLVVDNDGTVSRILSVSTGNNARFEVEGVRDQAYTPRGRFRVERKIAGWRESKLGKIYFPNYLIGGIAIHGSASVPAYPASHGCVRIPMYAAESLYRATPLGFEVLVHDGGSLQNDAKWMKEFGWRVFPPELREAATASPKSG